MVDQRRKRPRDTNQLAKFIVDVATGKVESCIESPHNNPKDPKAVEIGRQGGLKGGKARASKLSSQERHEIAKKAARARWGRRDGGESKQ